MNRSRLDKVVRLKTCFQSIQDYLGQSNPKHLKKLILLSLPSSDSHQYRKRAHTSKMQKTKLYQQCKNNSKLSQQTEIKEQTNEPKTGLFDVLRVKIHSNQRYKKNAVSSLGSSVVNRKNFKRCLKVQVQKQFTSKDAYQIKTKTNEKTTKCEDNEQKQAINSKIQQILKKFAKSHKQSNKTKSNPQKTIFHRREINKNLKNKILVNRTTGNFAQICKINPFYTIVGWQVQSNQQEEKL